MKGLCCSVLCTVAVAGAACGRTEEAAPPVATPALTLSRSTVTLGSPIQMKYRFKVADDAPAFNDDYWVFVHFLDRDDELMWTDDHRPPVPVRGRVCALSPCAGGGCQRPRQ